MDLAKELPAKRFYTIGEVSRLTGVQSYVLRYWETRGKILRPYRKSSRHRLYRTTDIQLIFEIKRLRDEEKLTIAAVRRQLQAQTQGSIPYQQSLLPGKFSKDKRLALLQDIRKELETIRDLLA